MDTCCPLRVERECFMGRLEAMLSRMSYCWLPRSLTPPLKPFMLIRPPLLLICAPVDEGCL
jgi:hypothetical protein